MKKTKLLAVGLGAIMSLSVGGVLAGCNQDEPNPTPTPTELTEVTKGVWSFAVPGYEREMILKFNEDGTFYAHNLMEEIIRGKYDVVDMEVTYIDSGADDIVNWVKDGENWSLGSDNTDDKADQKSVKAIKFYEADGTTPLTMNDSHYYSGIDSNVVAFTEGRIWNITIRKEYAVEENTRTLRQNVNRNFGVQDEKRQEASKYMVKELPDYADDGDTVKDYYFTIYDNATYTNMLAANRETGTWTKSGDNYTLTKDDGTAGGTLAVTANGATYTPASGTAIELVTYSENVSSTETKLKELTATLNLGIDVTFTLTFKSDGTVKMTNSMNNAAFDVTAKWALDTSTGMPNVTFSETSSGAMTFGWGEGGTVKFSWTGALGQSGEKTIDFSMPASELGALNVAPAVTDKKVLTATLNLGIDVTFTLTFKSDGTVKMTNSMNNAAFDVTAKWALDTSTGMPNVTFSETSSGAMTFGWGEGGTVKFSWTGTLGQSGEQTIDFSMPASELSALQ